MMTNTNEEALTGWISLSIEIYTSFRSGKLQVTIRIIEIFMNGKSECDLKAAAQKETQRAFTGSEIAKAFWGKKKRN